MKVIGCAQDVTGRLWFHPEVYFCLIRTKQRKFFVLCLVKFPIMTYVIFAERKLQILTTRLGIVQKNVRRKMLVVAQCPSIKKSPKEEVNL